MKAMIFAAGLGTRLGGIATKIPKALVEINGKSALQLTVENIVSFGFSDIIINIHHHAGKMKDEIERLKVLGYRLSVSDETDLLLETGGGLYKARWFFDDKPFLLYNVDIITDMDIGALYRFHLKSNGIATLAVRDAPDERVFLTDIDGLVKGWRNKKTGEEVITGNIKNLNEKAFSGIHIVEPEIFRFMNEGVYSMTSLYVKLAGHQKISTFNHNKGYFFDIGTPFDIEKASSFLQKKFL